MNREDRLEVARAVMEVETRERRRMAEELHDDVLQLLAAARLALADDASSARSVSLIDAAIQRGRQICRGMETPRYVGDIGFTLSQICDSIFAVHELVVDLLLEPMPVLDETTHDVLTSCAHELLVNVAKHGDRSDARLYLSCTRYWITLRVDDDGPGFSSQERSTAGGGLGMRFVQRRVRAMAGEMDWWTRAGGGASVLITLPRES